MAESHLNVVLIEPEIPQNTGNVGRSCVGLGARLHLVGKLGFSLDSAQLKRAGLDYWPKLDLHIHESWECFMKTVSQEADFSFFSTHGTLSYWDKEYRFPQYLIFGSESRGFPVAFYQRYLDQLIRIPIASSIRSLNLATAVGVALFEVKRQQITHET